MTDLPPRKEAELVELVRSIDVRAPESLHRKVEALVAERSAGTPRSTRAVGGRPRNRRLRPATASFGPRLAAVGVLAVVAIAALVIGLSSGGSSSLTLHQASALTLAGATGAAPKESPPDSGKLAADVEGISFPYWEDRFGWRSTGTRTDRIAGRTIKTVFYADHGRRIGYAIVAGASAPPIQAGHVAWLGGTAYTLYNVGGRPVVTWEREGRLCVMSGHGVDSATLLRLASWTDEDRLS